MKKGETLNKEDLIAARKVLRDASEKFDLGGGLKPVTSESESALHCRLLGERDDEMCEKGRREVTKWIRSHKLIEPDKDSLTRFEPFYQIEESELRKIGIRR